MITCTVCGQENDELNIVCSNCKSYLQGRVDALDLFSTMWGIIESPGATFRRIVLAKHKNYMVVLSALFGVNLMFEIGWFRNWIPDVMGLPALIAAAVLLGPPLGILFVLVMAGVLRLSTKLLGGRASQKNMFAALAYALLPMVLSLVFLVPLEIAIFGADFFGTNPPPMVIKPVEYSILLGLKALAWLYAVFLLVGATLAASGLQPRKSVPVAAIVLMLLGAGVAAVHFV